MNLFLMVRFSDLINIDQSLLASTCAYFEANMEEAIEGQEIYHPNRMLVVCAIIYLLLEHSQNGCLKESDLLLALVNY